MTLARPQAGTGAATPLLEFRNISKGFGAVKALRDVSTVVAKPEKRVELLRILAAQVNPTRAEAGWVPSRIVLEFDDVFRGSINLADQAARSRS